MPKSECLVCGEEFDGSAGAVEIWELRHYRDSRGEGGEYRCKRYKRLGGLFNRTEVALAVYANGWLNKVNPVVSQRRMGRLWKV